MFWEKENEEEDARYENRNDEEAAGIGGGGTEGEEGEVLLCVKIQSLSIGPYSSRRIGC